MDKRQPQLDHVCLWTFQGEDGKPCVSITCCAATALVLAGALRPKSFRGQALPLLLPEAC